MNNSMASARNMNHGHQNTLSGRRDYRLQHGLRWQHRPGTPKTAKYLLVKSSIPCLKRLLKLSMHKGGKKLVSPQDVSQEEAEGGGRFAFVWILRANCFWGAREVEREKRRINATVTDFFLKEAPHPSTLDYAQGTPALYHGLCHSQGLINTWGHTHPWSSAIWVFQLLWFYQISYSYIPHQSTLLVHIA